MSSMKVILGVSVIAACIIGGGIWVAKKNNLMTPTGAETTNTLHGGAASTTQGAADEVFGDWRLHCDAHGCHLYQNLLEQKSKQRVASVYIGKLGGKDLSALFMGPLGIYVPSGMAIQVDQHKQRGMVIHQCTAQGCAGQIEIDAAMLKEFEGGDKLQFGVMSQDRKTVVIPFSLVGFGNALKALREKEKEYPAQAAPEATGEEPASESKSEEPAETSSAKKKK